MRYGFTTGSCAAAAAKAAAYMLLTGREKTEITIETPKGIPFHAAILDRTRSENRVSCAVRKDGGDDPDVTTGALIYAAVSIVSETREEETQIVITGGAGVGRVTKPGLDQPVGNAAINHVPREMINKEVTEVCRLTDFTGRLSVEISVPGGEELAQKTFNPRLGIVGGISILGTTGVVEPMSSQALLDTIYVELRQKRAQGKTCVAVSPGNYGLDFMRQAYGFDLEMSVKCSNFIGDTIDMARKLGFEKMLLTGHIGKLVKVSGGIMNTHSREGDCRMELMAAAAIRAGATTDVSKQLLEAVATEEAVRILKEEKLDAPVMEILMEKIHFYLKKRAGSAMNGNAASDNACHDMQIECIMYANEFGELAKTKGACALLEEIKTAEKE